MSLESFKTCELPRKVKLVVYCKGDYVFSVVGSRLREAWRGWGAKGRLHVGVREEDRYLVGVPDPIDCEGDHVLAPEDVTGVAAARHGDYLTP